MERFMKSVTRRSIAAAGTAVLAGIATFERRLHIDAARALGLRGHHHTEHGPRLATALHAHRDRTSPTGRR
jgi:hypothetical protein